MTEIETIEILIKKEYTHDQLINMATNTQVMPIYTLIILARLYHQKKHAQTVQQQQSLNRAINTQEDVFKHIQFHSLDEHIINAIMKCIQKNPGLFRNHIRQLQELCISQRNDKILRPQLAKLYSMLHFPQEKQLASSIQNHICQIFDAFKYLLILIDFENEQSTDHHFITDDFKQHQNNNNNNQLKNKIKYSVIYQIVKDQEIANIKDSFEFLIMLLEAQLHFIKEDLIIELPIQQIIQVIQHTLKINETYSDYLEVPYPTQHTQSVQQQLQNKLNTLRIEKQINLNPQQYKELHRYIQQCGIRILNLLNGILQNQIVPIIMNSIQQSLLCDLSLLISKQTQTHLTTRLQLTLQEKLLDTLEIELPRFLKNMQNYLKSERCSLVKKTSTTSDIRLGIQNIEKLTYDTVKLLKQRLSDQINALSAISIGNLCNGYSLELTKRQYQLLFISFSLPHEQLYKCFAPGILLSLLNLAKVTLQNYNELDMCIIQPLTYFLDYECEIKSIDLDIQIACDELKQQIQYTFGCRKTLNVENYVSTMKQLNDQFQQIQKVYDDQQKQSQQSQQQYYSCKTNQTQESNQISQQAINQIRKTRSFVGEEESSSKPDEQNEMFYSIINPPEPIKEVHVRLVNANQQNIQPDIENDNDEIPQVVFD